MNATSMMVAIVGLAGAGLAVAEDGSNAPVPTATAPDAGPGASPDANVRPDADPRLAAQVLGQMHMANEVMISAAKVAMDTAESELVRKYAERLWRDHRMGAREVEEVAQALAVHLEPPPPDLEQRLQQVIQTLDAADGAAFDDAYVLAMRTTREQMMIPMLRAALIDVDEPRVEDLIERVLPILEQHVAMAEYLQQQRVES